ncbi:uncharacterized protein [Asterias amurensis]|uniref:uncharacterized protein isoform X1 n=2 Tax=Asterias amurensis TaxID=7602 RepID=UPI003AB2EF25
MMAVWWGLPVPLILVFLSVGMGYRSGAPREACVTMQPGHTNTVAMTAESPYHLEVHLELTPAGEYVVVSIEGTSSFRGFFLQARDADSSSTDAVGSFPSGGFNSGRSETVSCNDVADSALTHSNKGVKREMTGTWKAPEDGHVKAVYFIATVVRSFDEYWVGIVSRTIHLTGRVDNDESTFTTPLSGSASSTFTTAESAPSKSPYGYPSSYPETTTVPGGVTSDSSTITDDDSATTGVSDNQSTSATMDDQPVSTGWTTNSQRTTGKHEVTQYEAFESTAADDRSRVTTDSYVDIFTTRNTVSNRRTLTKSDLSTSAELSTPVDLSTPEDVLTHVELSTQSYETTIKEMTEDLSTITSSRIHHRTHLTHTGATLNSTPSTPLSTVVNISRPVDSTTPTHIDVSRRSEMSTTPSERTSKKTDELMSTLSSTTVQPRTQPPHLSSTMESTLSTTIESSTPAPVEMEVSTTLSKTEDDTDSSYASSSTTFQPRTQLTHLPLESTTDSSLGTIITSGTSTTNEPITAFITDSPTTGTDYHTTPLGEENTSTVDQPKQSTDDVSEEVTVKPFENVTDYAHSSPDPTTNNSTVSDNSQTTVDFETSSRYNATFEVSTLDASTDSTTTDGATQTEPQATTTAETIPVSSNTPLGPQATTRGETTPVTVSTFPPVPQRTDDVTEVATNDNTEVMDFSTSVSYAELSTYVPIATSTDTAPLATSTTERASFTLEEPNEVRMRLRIVDIPFTEDFRDSNSNTYKRVADEVEQAIWDLYMRNKVTTMETVKVLQITKGSVVPEVQLLASQDLIAAEKSNWLSVMYNEISSGGKLGNFTVSDISALSADGTYTEVDPCFLLPCPDSMVCFVYQSSCFSNCFLNTNYCMNDGACRDPLGNTQLVSCSCTSNHEGERCEVTKIPVTPDTGDLNVNSLFAILWGSVGAVCFVLIVIFLTLLIRKMRKRRSWRHTAKLMSSRESGLSQHSGESQMESYAKHLTSIRAGVLIDLSNISISASEDESNDPRRRSRSSSSATSETESLDQQPRFIDGGVHIGGMPDILQGASTTDYELDIMTRPLNPKRKSVSFNDVTEMIDFVATENFSLAANREGADSSGNFQVRWDFQVDSSQSGGASTS